MNTSSAPAAFDPVHLDLELAAGAAPLLALRAWLKEGSSRLAAAFEEGAPVTELVQRRAQLLDRLLGQAWTLHLSEDAPAALIAVGGYGRGELLPASDIDLLILLPAAPAPPLVAALERLIAFLWDLGLQVGHSIRTLEECLREAERDVTVITNLSESRLLTGPPPLFQSLRAAITPDRLWPSERFFRAKRDEQRQRHHRFDDTISNLEPNVKDGPGGLRDIQTIGWVAKRHFGGETLHDLVERGFLTEEEYQRLMESQTLLWRIRFALHLHTGRPEERLLFDHQRALAKQFGYQDRPGSLAVEQFMQAFYRAALAVQRLNEQLLQHFEEAILGGDPPAEVVEISKRFRARNGFLEVRHDFVFHRYPFALLEIFHELQRHPELKGVRASTIRLLRANLHRIDDRFRNDLRSRSLFMEILRSRSGVSRELRRMNRYGVLAAYIPAFANIVGRMQYDLFHAYTVDEHTLFVVNNLRRFTMPEHAWENPLCHEVIHTLPKPELLYLGGLFHDIAKGRGGDHSSLGADEAFAFCQHHGLSLYDSRLVAWLVERHLLMSMTAQRQDISDPEVVHRFARELGDLTHLNYLYLLTVADIRATNPRVWTSWKGALLKELYTATKRTLLRGLDHPPDVDGLLQEKQYAAYRLLEELRIPPQRAKELWFQLSVDYFLYYSAEEIVWQTQQVLGEAAELPLVRVRARPDRGCTEVFLYSRDQDNLFAATTATLDQLDLNILDARLDTTDDGFTLDSYQLLENDGSPITEERRAEILAELRQRLAALDRIDLRVTRRIPRQLKQFQVETRLEARQDPANLRTILKLVTADRPGLLAQVGAAFADCGIRLNNAKIATIGAEAEDTFFVTDRQQRPLDAPLLERLRQTLLPRLGAGGQQPCQ